MNGQIQHFPFNSLCEIPHGFYGLWWNIAVTIVCLSILFVRFGTPRKGALGAGRRTFNSLCEIRLWDGVCRLDWREERVLSILFVRFRGLLGRGFSAQCNCTFNSLCEILVERHDKEFIRAFILSILFVRFKAIQQWISIVKNFIDNFQFSLWDSVWEKRRSGRAINELSILFVRFNLSMEQLLVAWDVFTFNSLCEILQMRWCNVHSCWTFNSLCEIPRVFLALFTYLGFFCI